MPTKPKMSEQAGSRRMGAKPHWYKFYFGECPVCGKDKSYKQRMYSKKPKDPTKRYVHMPYNQTYDGCNY
jgi:hypothetical protein